LRTGDGDAAKLFNGITPSTDHSVESGHSGTRRPVSGGANRVRHRARPRHGEAAPSEFGSSASVLASTPPALAGVLGRSVADDELAAVAELDRGHIGGMVRDKGPCRTRRGLDGDDLHLHHVVPSGLEAQADAVRARMIDSLGLDSTMVDECGETLQLIFPGRYRSTRCVPTRSAISWCLRHSRPIRRS